MVQNALASDWTTSAAEARQDENCNSSEMISMEMDVDAVDQLDTDDHQLDTSDHPSMNSATDVPCVHLPPVKSSPSSSSLSSPSTDHRSLCWSVSSSLVFCVFFSCKSPIL